MEMQPSWLEKLAAEQATESARKEDPWRLALTRLHGRIGDDGVERLSTATIFDCLEVEQCCRGGGATRRLAKLMRQLNWTAVRLRRNGEQMRGYAKYPQTSLPATPLSISAQQTARISSCDG
jgi:hypothetical protein